MRFTSMSYTNIEWVSPSFRHKMSGRDLLRSDGQIRAVKLALDLFCRTFVFLASGSREASNFEPGAGTVTCFCEFSGQKRPEPGWRNLEWAHDEMIRCESIHDPNISLSRLHETRIGTLFSFWQWLRQCLVNLKNWAWTMNKVLSHSSEIVTLLSVLEEIYVAACGSFCVSAVPSEILKLVWIHPRNVLVLGTSPILLHPNMYQLRYIMIYI
jgi:hypothetical protein